MSFAEDRHIRGSAGRLIYKHGEAISVFLNSVSEGIRIDRTTIRNVFGLGMIFLGYMGLLHAKGPLANSDNTHTNSFESSPNISTIVDPPEQNNWRTCTNADDLTQLTEYIDAAKIETVYDAEAHHQITRNSGKKGSTGYVIDENGDGGPDAGEAITDYNKKCRAGNPAIGFNLYFYKKK